MPWDNGVYMITVPDKHPQYTREDIYDVLHSVIPMSVKDIARKLKVPTVRRINTLTTQMSTLMQRLDKLQEIGAIDWVPFSGYVLKQRIPLEETDGKKE